MSKKTIIIAAAVIVGIGIAVMLPLRQHHVIYGFEGDGFVFKLNGQPLEGATVTLVLSEPIDNVPTSVANTEIKTDKKGNYRIGLTACRPCPDDTFTLTFAKAGYRSIVHNVTNPGRQIAVKMAPEK